MPIEIGYISIPKTLYQKEKVEMSVKEKEKRHISIHNSHIILNKFL